jgi:hypothetical protein
LGYRLLLQIHSCQQNPADQGVNTAAEAPVLLRDLSKILVTNTEVDAAMANSKLHLLGWNEVALDYQSLLLALAWLGTQIGTDREYHPPLNLHYQAVSRFR